MENHIHIIASASDISKELNRFKSYTARVAIDFLKDNGHKSILHQLKTLKIPNKTDQEYQFWQEGAHPERIISPDMLNQKLNYIHNNPVKRGYVDNPGHWRYSSYRNYYEDGGILPIEIINV